MNIKLTEDQIEDVVIEDLVLQHKMCRNTDLKEALRTVLNFYLENIDMNSNEPTDLYMYGDPTDIRISINGQSLV